MNHYQLSAVVLPIHSNQIKNIQSKINKEDLVDWNFAPGGLPEQFHITLLNGIAGSIKDCQEALGDIIEQGYTLKDLELGYFESDDWIAPHIRIKNAETLALLNKKLRGNVPHIDSYPNSNPNEFKAHITLCYIKKNSFLNYEKMLREKILSLKSLTTLPPIFLKNIGYGKSEEVSLVNGNYLNIKLNELIKAGLDGTSKEFFELEKLANQNNYVFDLYETRFYPE